MDSPTRRSKSAVDGGSGGRRRANATLSRSSTSSDILVAPAPANMTEKSAVDAASPAGSEEVVPAQNIVAEVRHGTLLVVMARDAEGVDALRELLERSSNDRNHGPDGTVKEEFVKLESEGDDRHGPNHRGTYSKAHTLLHPEIQWVHRGQGRYLPVEAAKALQASHTPVRRESRPRGDSSSAAKPSQQRQSTTQPRTLRPQRSSLTTEEEDSKTRTSSLRRRLVDAQGGSAPDSRSARSTRHSAKAAPPTESGRRSSRISSTLVDYEEGSDGADTDEMGSDKEPTFNREYVEAHPNEKFYHTGNGWYKRGRRPPTKHMKNRDGEGHAIRRGRDGTYVFNKNTTIHVSQLEKYPGVEFHHCGNGWYRAGPDSSGLRASRFGGPVEEDAGEGEEDEDDQEEQEEEGDGEDANGTVDKSYMLKHPEVEWVHRGKGRYKRKSAVDALKGTSIASASVEPERDTTIYSKEYVLAHPDEEFHHRGNARYMRGPAPDHWALVRRKKSAPSLSVPEEVIDDTQLYSKAFVEAHPHLVFHHRGQGRYAVGPRKSSTQPESVVGQEGEDASDGDPDELVNRAYVEAHPNETFHHRGQGRWARGMPPPGSSRKVAVRGPGAAGRSNASEVDDAEDFDDGPAMTDLLVKSEGPEKYPHLKWYYRGGGKWSRTDKSQLEETLVHRAPKARGRTGRGSSVGAQLEHEMNGSHLADDDIPLQDKPGVKRRKVNKRGSYQVQDDGTATKLSSNSQSKAPTPKPRMLEPHEDVLTEEDLPQLYREDYSPPSEYIEDPAERLIRSLRPLNPPELFVNSLTKHDPAVRSLDNLKRLADNAQYALDQLQQEYLYLERITAPHARIPRKLARGGRAPMEQIAFEDRKEADLYDYSFDPRRLGFQDPEAQKIQRDAEGRELRNRRARTTVNGTLPGWNFGDDEPLGPRRAVKPVNRFDGIVDQPRKKAKLSHPMTGRTSKAQSPTLTPDRGVTPLGGPVRVSIGNGARGRLIGNVPRRIQELRGESVGREGTPGSGKKVRAAAGKNAAVVAKKDVAEKKATRKGKDDTEEVEAAAATAEEEAEAAETVERSTLDVPAGA